MDTKEINENTISRLYRIEHIEKLYKYFQEDPRKEFRMENRLCKSCFYSTGLSGQAFSFSNCKICNKEIVSPNTDVDHYCKECSEKYDICVKCGADIDLEMR